jgi:hypothetical protein
MTHQLTTTLNRIRAHGPCEDGWKKLLAALDRLLSTCALNLDDQEPGDIEAIEDARAVVAAAKGGDA